MSHPYETTLKEAIFKAEHYRILTFELIEAAKSHLSAMDAKPDDVRKALEPIEYEITMRKIRGFETTPLSDTHLETIRTCLSNYTAKPRRPQWHEDSPLGRFQQRVSCTDGDVVLDNALAHRVLRHAMEIDTAWQALDLKKVQSGLDKIHSVSKQIEILAYIAADQSASDSKMFAVWAANLQAGIALIDAINPQKGETE